MGLYIRLDVKPDQIDEERWEAVWLTGLQLLEQFPGPLATLIVDKKHQGRYVRTPRIHFETGNREEHWEVEGDLGSNRFAETFYLFRRLSHYQGRGQRSTQDEANADILWASAKNIDEGIVNGTRVFDSKSQGYPYHYAMLAVAVLVENSFPGLAIAHGDITRIQAEQVVPWAEAVLGRPLQLPVVAEPERLWSRMAKLYPGEPRQAIHRFLTLHAAADGSSWRAILRLESGPDAISLREAFQAELGHYNSLRQRGAESLIAALIEADDGLERAFAWVCDPGPIDSAKRHDPEELLECLCDLLVPLSQGEREVFEVLTPPPDQLPTIDTQLFQVFSSLMGKPTPCAFFMEEDALGDEFAKRWPDQAARFRELLAARTQKQRSQVEEMRAAIDQRLAAFQAAEAADEAEPSWLAADEAEPFRPGAEFIAAEIARQKRTLKNSEKVAREMGAMVREGLTKNVEFRRCLDECSREKLLEQISFGSYKFGFALSETAWDALRQATHQELRHLVAIALLPTSERSFCETRLSILETPSLWPLVAGQEEAA